MSKFCAKCQNATQLSASHSIPMSFFRKILKRQGGGQFVEIKIGAKKNRLIQNTGSSPILCKTCECWFNTNYDQYIDRTLNTVASPRTVGDLKKPIFLRTETNRMSQFILSVFWRASLSNDPIYERFKPPPRISKDLADLLFHRPDEIRKRFSFSVHKLHFGVSSLPPSIAEDFVMPPGIVRDSSGKSEAWRFAGRGWLFTAYCPRLSSTQVDRLQCYRPDKRVIRAPRRDVLGDPDMFEILKAGFEKDRNGHTKNYRR